MSKIYTMIEPKKNLDVYYDGTFWKVNKHIIYEDGTTGYLLRKAWDGTRKSYEVYKPVKCDEVEKYESWSDMAEMLSHQARCDRRDREIAEARE